MFVFYVHKIHNMMCLGLGVLYVLGVVIDLGGYVAVLNWYHLELLS